jgi:hypothetical protein
MARLTAAALVLHFMTFPLYTSTKMRDWTVAQVVAVYNLVCYTPDNSLAGCVPAEKGADRRLFSQPSAPFAIRTTRETRAPGNYAGAAHQSGVQRTVVVQRDPTERKWT